MTPTAPRLAREPLDRLEQLAEPALVAADGEQLGEEEAARLGRAGRLGDPQRLAVDPLGLVEPPGDVRPLAAPGERGVRVERLVELVRERLEAGVRGLGGGDVAELDEVEDAPVQRERGDLAGADAARRSRSPRRWWRAARARARCRAARRGGPSARRRARPSSPTRRAIATASAPSRAGRSLGVGEREVLGEAREQPRPQRALGVPERGERLLEPRDVGGVGGDRHVEAPAGAERGAGEDLGVAGDARRPRRTPRGRRARWPASARRRGRSGGRRARSTSSACPRCQAASS